jgi:YgiT-type zinc finger domain-containing protein
MKQCPLCQGTIKVDYRNFSYNADGKAHTIPGIKYYICTSCDEKFIDEEDSKKIDEYKENN